ncbi:hypothetical protein A3C57_01310 [Candidatus Nomurabacteria bacterium RIFCSPHIGHO2_02_FULL_33_12]|uniref:Uncharacterized protein n=1 Tax=Candidatus Nomurabacteria bacterium RIFCSPLOWO2_01_FULL_33_17 TaxID=1801764 RepID=A0A1F6WRG0_9BACT|nr:MAG: hypothetical protein A3C57_01310 [Candidatus Nomurabacteria bacterium RIFCSPHIGHO2_02_FULL_33_12]OGI84335.1 MAG: hypothetical protein A2903_00515 [Candidatus Nomurabacteria bacterium RIFCSPLOWO2_01_FULL_33_17]
MDKIYKPEVLEKKHLSLSDKEKGSINNITLGIEEVEDYIKSFAVESGDIVKTLQNGHPLNRLIKNEKDETLGYIACEDFVPKEAYIKYFGTNASSGRNLLSEIPTFVEYAKEHGYTKLNFHGWNNRLNNILTRYGFERVRTDNMASFLVDFYEKSLVEEKSNEEVSQARINAFEEKYLNKLKTDYSKTLAMFKDDIKVEKEKLINLNYDTLLSKLTKEENFIFKERQQVILKLKLARYFQNKEKSNEHNEELDVNVLFDALIESPRFIDTDKGSIQRLFEVHIQKTMQNLAELRKKRAELVGENDLNPYEALFETQSGKYYMARLLNMPHLEDESLNMGTSCVGTSDHYYKEILKGNIEILSFRTTPKINKNTNKLENDSPIMTLEYNLKTKTIEQMKKYNDEYLTSNDPYFKDVIDALKNLRNTKTDTGELRDFKKINESELQNFTVKENYVLTENGEVYFKDFDPESNVFVLKIGEMNVTPQTSKIDAVKIMHIVEGIKVTPEEIAYTANEVTKQTKVFVGKLENGIFDRISNIEYVYTKFLNNRIKTVELDSNIQYPKNTEEWVKAYNEQGIQLEDSNINKMLGLMEQTELTEDYKFVILSVEDLGFDSSATYEKICEKAESLGLELCAQDDGPKLRLSYEQLMGTYFRTGMKSIKLSDVNLRLWSVNHYDDGTRYLDWSSGNADFKYDTSNKFAFRLRK